MDQYEFPVTGPIQVRASVRASDVTVTATETSVATVQLTGDRELAERAHVDLVGGTLEIDVPQVRIGLFSGSGSRLRVEVGVPTGSSVLAKSGSGDLTTAGGLAEVDLRSGSGDLQVSSADRARTDSGSGDARIDHAGTVESSAGSGSIAVGTAEDVSARTGSGDVLVDHAASMRATAGSGDLRIGETSTATLRTASGSVQVKLVRNGEIGATAASGSVTVGVADGTPTLLDCQAVSGRVRSELEPSGEPAEGEDSVVLRLRSASGSITVLRA